MRHAFSTASLLACLGIAAPGVAAAQGDSPSTGFSLWIRAPGGSIQDLFASAAAAPPFAVGYRGETFSFGFGIGLTLASTSDEDTFTGGSNKDETSLSLFQVGPTLLLDVWRSDDGRTRGNLVGALSVGRLSVTDKSEFRATGVPPQTSESSSTGTLIGFRAGLGGDHFLAPHFALGLEAGLQVMLATGIEEEGAMQSVSLAANGAYSAVRVILVF